MRVQEFIHKFTEGSGNRFLQLLLVSFAMFGLAVWYDLAQFKNQSTIEGMDASQLARNLAEGHGFSTQLVRPFSVHLIRQHRGDKELSLNKEPLLKEWHPDLANAPLYPAVLAVALKVNPWSWPDIRPEANPGGQFDWYWPDLWIAIMNQGLFFVAAWMVFRLGRRLFDDSVAWVSAAAFAGSELFWKFSTSGQSTMLLVVIFLAVVEVLARIEPETKESAKGAGWLVGMAAFAGLLAGLAGLTRYGFALVIFPVGLFLGSLATPKRFAMVGAAAGAFALVLAPWVARNFVVSGTPFGTAGYALVQGTELFKGFQLERTLNPDLSLITGGMLWSKMVMGVREILEKELPRLGGSWVSAFFLVGVMVPFRKTVLLRLRTFLLVCLGLFIVAQALGRTGLSTESAELTTENLLVVLAPLVFLFGVSLFFVLLEQFGMALPALRLIAVGVFVAVASAPLLFALLMPVGGRLAYPPYYPPYLQEKCEWLPEDGLLMTDVPWATAWYGHRQSLWLSLKFSEEPTIRMRNDFAAMNQTGKPIRGLYLSPRLFKSVETDPLRKWVQREERGANWEPYAGDWEGFVLLGAMLFREIPEGFALSKAPFGPPFTPLPELFLTDSERPARKSIKPQ